LASKELGRSLLSASTGDARLASAVGVVGGSGGRVAENGIVANGGATAITDSLEVSAADSLSIMLSGLSNRSVVASVGVTLVFLVSGWSNSSGADGGGNTGGASSWSAFAFASTSCLGLSSNGHISGRAGGGEERIGGIDRTVAILGTVDTVFQTGLTDAITALRDVDGVALKVEDGTGGYLTTAIDGVGGQIITGRNTVVGGAPDEEEVVERGVSDESKRNLEEGLVAEAGISRPLVIERVVVETRSGLVDGVGTVGGVEEKIRISTGEVQVALCDVAIAVGVDVGRIKDLDVIVTGDSTEVTVVDQQE